MDKLSFYGKLGQSDIMNTVNNFTDALKQSNTFNGVVSVPIQWTLEDYDKENMVERFKIKLLYHSSSNYTTVASVQGRTTFNLYDEILEFNGCHDSCWRDHAESVIRRFKASIEKSLIEKYGDDFEEKYNFNIYISHGFGIKMFPNHKLKILTNNKVKLINNEYI